MMAPSTRQSPPASQVVFIHVVGLNDATRRTESNYLADYLVVRNIETTVDSSALVRRPSLSLLFMPRCINNECAVICANHLLRISHSLARLLRLGQVPRNRRY